MNRPFTARYEGRCAAECGLPITRGETVQYIGDDLVHTECATGMRSQRAPTICPACHLTRPCDCQDAS